MKHLRELARKHLGRGYSKLTKKELIAALAGFVPALKALARLSPFKLSQWLPGKKPPAAKPPPPPPPPQKAPEKAPEKAAAPRPVPPRSTPTPAPVLEGAFKPAQVVNFPRRVKSSRPMEEDAAGEGESAADASPQHVAEPLVEGFFVARVQGEGELRRHHLTEEQAPPRVNGNVGYEENLGELPVDYGDDLAVALARDPSTLFVTWNFSALTRSRALEGLEHPRAFLRVFEGEKLVREEEFALESRSFYIYGLPPGRVYRVEAHFVGQDGRARRLAQASQRITLPQEGPSGDTSVRFMRMSPPPPVSPQSSAADSPGPATPARVPSVEEREYITWHRVPLPGSEGLAHVSEVRRERRVSEWPEEGSAPAPGGLPSPSPVPSEQYLGFSRLPQGSSEQSPELSPEPSPELSPYLASSRPGGSSEQNLELARYLESSRHPGSSEQYLDFSRHPSGSSEQRVELEKYLEAFSRRPGGASEQLPGRQGQADASLGSSGKPSQPGRGR
ncbi:DUF4912 domain-containing protein [Stigmatella sp. ncwal1]|uniref:DUF4912 domain-containing protein n=1 Tax=Stigmatella ashevillensis TaxID=2995309 RepID=A0ABT5D6F6_9BACT|nr:DUF4912 domain-containing protein [Stigmatella ashevillena]